MKVEVVIEELMVRDDSIISMLLCLNDGDYGLKVYKIKGPSQPPQSGLPSHVTCHPFPVTTAIMS